MAQGNQSHVLSDEVMRRRRRSGVVIFFLFMLLHQTDRYLISPLTSSIIDAFGINEAQMGAVTTGAILVGAVFFPLWGYLYDRYARPKVLSAASFLWGATTWLAAIVPTYPLFIATRAATGIDDASYPGIYSMISDLYGPERRGKIIATLQLAAPFSFMVATGLALGLRDSLGWRGIFILTGALGVVMSVVIYFLLKDVPRGTSEPTLQDLEEMGSFRFNWKTARGLLKKRTLFLLFLQQFIHLFPFQAISFWFFRYLEVERNLSDMLIGVNSGLFVLMGMIGYLSAGALGDYAFSRSKRGRLIVGGAGISLAAVLLTIAFSVPLGQDILFTVIMAIAALFANYAHPNVVPTIQDITEPEVRSTAHAMLGIAEQSGSALAPLLVGIIAVNHSLQFGLLTVVGIGFLLSSSVLWLSSLTVKSDIEQFETEMHERSAV